MYEAERWKNDPRFQAPMIRLPGSTKSVFVSDFIRLEDGGLGKVRRFFQKVRVVNLCKNRVQGIKKFIH